MNRVIGTVNDLEEELKNTMEIDTVVKEVSGMSATNSKAIG